MRKIIGKTAYDTKKASRLGHIYVEEPIGYEEQLFVTDNGRHFLYRFSRAKGRYIEPKIIPINDTQAEEWKLENGFL